VSRHQFTRQSRHNPGDFAPFFDWAEEREPEVGSAPPEGIAERIGAACEDWMRRGGLIVRGTFGVGTVNRVRENRGRDERGQIIWGGITGTYAVNKHCCPLAPLLEGLPSRFNPVADFAAVLGVDHLWAVGFIHGVDKEVVAVGKRLGVLEESLSYVDGRACGAKIAERFVTHIQGGWEV
jgi:hypothetical protein